MGFCVHCGTPRQVGGRFCGICGAAFAQPTAVSPPSAGATQPLLVQQPAPVMPLPGPTVPPAWVATPPAPWHHAAAAPNHPVSMRLLGRWLAALLALMAVPALLMFAAAAWQWGAFTRYLDAPVDSFAETQAIDDLISAENFHTAMAGVMVLASIAVGVVFVVWLFRAARNARRAGAIGTLHEGWAIGGWFVPVGMFFLPVMIVTQVWRAADEGLVRPIGTAWRHVRGSGLVIGWWLTFAAAILTNTAAGGIYDPAGTSEQLEAAYGLWLAAAFLFAVAAVIGAVMVYRLSERQDHQQAAAARHLDPQVSAPLAAAS